MKPLSCPRLQVFDTCWGNEPILNYLINGHFVWRPLGPWRPVEYRNPGGAPPGDYVGLNFYSRYELAAARVKGFRPKALNPSRPFSPLACTISSCLTAG